MDVPPPRQATAAGYSARVRMIILPDRAGELALALDPDAYFFKVAEEWLTPFFFRCMQRIPGRISQLGN